uniref:Galectin n=1 Tax=Heterorhabditis bacteriophora TaxID=37862 RepID=A0A1I7XJJ7_HETBA
MEIGSVFHISGSIKLMRMKVTLIQRGLSFLPNFNEFAIDGPSPRAVSNIVVDELNLQWQQKVSSPFELNGTQQDDVIIVRLERNPVFLLLYMEINYQKA